MTTPTVDAVMKMFNINTKKSDESDEEIYSSICPSQESFESKLGEVADIIKEAAPSAPSQEIKVTEKSNQVEIQNVVVEVQGDTQEIKMESPGVFDEEVESVESEDSLVIKGSVKLDDWNIESTSPKFDSFYVEKRKILKELMSDGGRKNFKRFIKDLIAARVDVSVSMYDVQGIIEKMQAVQGWRDRVKDIQMDCRYFKWEKAVELLTGLLARVEYAKPAAKQAGVIYEHFGDVELYCAELRDIYKSAEIVSKILDGAYECLSRQLTIATPRHDRSIVYESPNFTRDQPSKKEDVLFGDTISLTDETKQIKEEVKVPDTLSDFDELLVTPVEEEETRKEVNLEDAVKKINWDSII